MGSKNIHVARIIQFSYEKKTCAVLLCNFCILPYYSLYWGTDIIMALKSGFASPLGTTVPSNPVSVGGISKISTIPLEQLLQYLEIERLLKVSIYKQPPQTT